MSIIKIDNITKDYGAGRGVFDLSLTVNKGEVVGFLGPNGAGKTTTVRQLLGFIKSDKGSCEILGNDCWKNANLIQENVGYLPGEISFPSNLTGYEMMEKVSDLRGMTSLDRARELIKYFDLDPRGELKRMSKGMKQKVALVLCFMHDPDIIILDEPTSGLDPLMQDKFVQLIKEEKAKGKTIFMSSHMFEEVEKTCDRVEIIKHGKLIASVLMKDIEHKKNKEFEIRFKSKESYQKSLDSKFEYIEKNEQKLRITVLIHDNEINDLLKLLSSLDVEYLSEKKYTLEKYFMKYYSQEVEKNV